MAQIERDTPTVERVNLNSRKHNYITEKHIKMPCRSLVLARRAFDWGQPILPVIIHRQDFRKTP